MTAMRHDVDKRLRRSALARIVIGGDPGEITLIEQRELEDPRIDQGSGEPKADAEIFLHVGFGRKAAGAGAYRRG